MNGREVLTKKTKRDAKAGQETVTVALGQGENEVLIKIVNNDKKSGFYFDVKGAEFPKEILPVLLVEEAKRSETQRKSRPTTGPLPRNLIRSANRSSRRKRRSRACGVRSSPRLHAGTGQGSSAQNAPAREGNFLSKGEVVQAGFPGAFHQPKKESPNNRMGWPDGCCRRITR